VLQYISFDWRMRDFVELGLVFSIPSQEIGLGKRLRNDVFCFEWDVKLNQWAPKIYPAAVTSLGLSAPGGRRDEVRPSPNFPNFFGGTRK